MASISKPALVWWIALCLMLANNINVHSQTVTFFIFTNFDANPLGLTYQGDANVPSNASFLRLTNSSEFPTRNSVGRVLYAQPVQFWSSSRQSIFATTLQFVVTPSRGGAADGLSFFIAPVNTTVGAAGTVSSMAVAVVPTFLRWSLTPTAGRLRPGFSLHLGIDIESKYSVHTARFDSGSGELVTATISYNSNTKLIKVEARTASQIASPTYTYDLTTVLHEQVRVGISASTGDYVGIYGVFDLVSWSFTSTLVPVTTSTATSTAPASISVSETYTPQHVAV